jgi:PAS domain S-box-containing protein
MTINQTATNAVPRDSEERFRVIAEMIPQIVWTARADGWIDYDNPRWFEYTGLDPEKGAGWGWESVIHPDDLSEIDRRWKEAIRTGEGYTIEYRLRRRDGEYRWHLDRAIPLKDAEGRIFRWFGTCTDIEDQKRIEAALRESEKRLSQLNENLEKEVDERTKDLKKKEQELYQTQKLEAIGRLAGGVAHDFNNLLTGIRGTADLLKEELSADNPRALEFEEMQKGIDRAFALTKQLLAFGRRQISQPRVLEFYSVIEEMTRMLRRLIGEHIQIELSRDGDGRVRADRGQLEQVLMNLALNARDAMPRGGKIQIHTRTLTLPLEGGSLKSFQVPPGSYVLMEVKDTGCGMDAETVSHIFEPFFTTKEFDHGTGLGLSTVYGIVKQNGGDIQVTSVPGQGTTFSIVLPAVAEQTVETPAPESSQPSLLGHQETVLIVEDEALVRKVVARRLVQNGYQVLTAGSGQEALHTASMFLSKIDMVLSDVVMPEMDGHKLVQQLQALKPNLAVLYMSGYPREIICPQNQLDPNVQFIDKSALSSDLLFKVREVLNRAAATH